MLAVTENQPELCEPTAHHFVLVADGCTDQPATVLILEKNHGRLEVRTCPVNDAAALCAWLDPDARRDGLCSISAVTGERRGADQPSVATRSTLSSLAADAPGWPPRCTAIGASWTGCTGCWT